MLLQASSQGPPVSAVVCAAADWWLSTVRPAPLRLFSKFGAVYKYSDLLTYLPVLTYLLTEATSKKHLFLLNTAQ